MAEKARAAATQAADRLKEYVASLAAAGGTTSSLPTGSVAPNTAQEAAVSDVVTNLTAEVSEARDHTMMPSSDCEGLANGSSLIDPPAPPVAPQIAA